MQQTLGVLANKLNKNCSSCYIYLQAYILNKSAVILFIKNQTACNKFMQILPSDVLTRYF